MSNLLSIHNSKNQVGIGTNTINVSSDLTIKENTRRYIVCNTNNNSLAVHRTIELEDETTLSTVKTHSISSAKLLYIGSNNEISSLALSSSNYLKISNTGGLVLIDKTAPTVQSISATDGTYGFISPNNIINITVNFNETVTVTGTPSLTLSNSATATYISGDNSTSILFRYTIQQNDTNSSSLSVSGLSGTIKDLSDNLCTSISGTLGSVVVDTIAPVLSNASSIGTTNDATPTLTFDSNEAGTITSSLSFSTSTSAIAGSNSITFNTLSNNTYSSQWIKVTDTAGNTSNQLTISTFTVTTNPYATSDIRHWFWIQNQTHVTAIRGYVGYVEIKGSNQSGAGWSDRIAFTRTGTNTTVYSGRYNTGSTWTNSGGIPVWPSSSTAAYSFPDDQIWKCTFNSSTNTWQIENTGHTNNVAIGYWGPNWNNNGWSTTYHIEHDTNTSSTSTNGGEWKIKELSTNTYVEFWGSNSYSTWNYGYVRTGANASGTNKSTSFRIICH